jgi:hypothetical protein
MNMYNLNVFGKVNRGLINRAKVVIATAALVMTGSIASLHAAPSDTQLTIPTTTSITGTVRVTIPFAFSVADKTFAGGEYYIGPTNDRTVAIRSVGGKESVVVLTNAVSETKVSSPRLVFHKYGEQYFLTQAWLRASDEGREFVISSAESKWTQSAPRGEITVTAMQ